MNNVNMGGMVNTMGAPVAAGIPMANNGQAGAAVRQQMPTNDQRSLLNTYIYEYFLRNEMYDCARSLLQTDQTMNVPKDSPGRRRDENGNPVGNGTGGEDGDNKDDIDMKRPDDLPAPNLPKECPESCFLYEWWCLFWDMFNAQRGKGEGRNVLQYVAHTQHQSRMRQEHQQNMLRAMRPEMMPQYQQMMRNPQGMNMNQNEIARKAMQNNRNATPQQMQMLQQKQQQMQRDPSDMDGNRQQRPQSPGSAENAPSPSKRPRLEGGAPFNPQQQMMPNGRQASGGIPGQQVGDTGPSNPLQATHMQLANGFDPNNLTAQQFQAFQSGANPAGQAKTIAAYQANLTQHQQSQMPGKGMPNPGGPQNQSSPMMPQGQDGSAIAGYYNAGEVGPNGLRAAPGGQPGGGGNHALQDYQMQLMLLEQQNKKRLMMARQEQDNMTIPRTDGGAPGAIGPNGQPFQGTSPQGPRSVNSPNPTDQMKRTPLMNPAGIPSPLPEGQSRGSPSAMNFGVPGNQMDPNMAPPMYKMNGMEGNMAQGMPNGMRPPSSHPAGFNGQMTPQQQQLMRAQQQQQQQQQQAANWQAGPNGAAMIQQPSQQGPGQPAMGTPQQRAMPPPSAPAANAAANGRPSSPQQGAAPPTPQQANKANPKAKKDTKDTKAKRATKKASGANLNSGATPSGDATQEPATPTPATPITPVAPQPFTNKGPNGAVQPVTNGQATTTPANVNVTQQQPQQPDGGLVFNLDNTGFEMSNFEFTGPSAGNGDVLQDFDFDSFLHNDDQDMQNFTFDTAFLDNNEIGAE
ncbi:SOM1 protein [Xylogone sp. PMI_703]|nr:SOM1 protein [Xylogone sp. PMI_703]